METNETLILLTDVSDTYSEKDIVQLSNVSFVVVILYVSLELRSRGLESEFLLLAPNE
jgi:hypothetical protein